MHPILRIAFLLWPVTLLAGTAQQDWASVKALDAGPPTQPKTPSEAVAQVLAHVDKQQTALRAFLAAHPNEEKAFEAMLRLARVLDRQAEMKSAPVPQESALLMGKAGELATTPARRTEYEFALLSRRMRTWRDKRPPIEERRAFLEQVRKFEAAYPDDRRIASLLVEIAALFDFEPATKDSLLKQARKLTKDPDLIAQITDDERRLGFLGKPIPLRFTTLDGRRIDVKEWQGKVVGLVFFATWSPPSKAGLIDLKRAFERSGGGVEFAAVSLDSQQKDLTAFVRDNGISCPVAWDGKGWSGPLIQALGINTVPTAWLLDKKGVLRSLDALEQPDDQIRQLLDGR